MAQKDELFHSCILPSQSCLTLPTTNTKKGGQWEWIGNGGVERGREQYTLLPKYLPCTKPLKTKVKHGITLVIMEGAFNTTEWWSTGVQNWHKGRDVVRLRTSPSAYYFRYKQIFILKSRKFSGKCSYERTPKRSPSLKFCPCWTDLAMSLKTEQRGRTGNRTHLQVLVWTA